MDEPPIIACPARPWSSSSASPRGRRSRPRRGCRTAFVRFSVNDPSLRSTTWTTSGHYRFDLDRGMIIEDVTGVRLQAVTEGMTIESVNRAETRVFP